MKIFDVLDLTQPGVVLGNHGCWLPDRKVKLPFQWGGGVTKYTKREAVGSRETIVDEVAILRALAAERMAPPVGDLVFFRNIISTYPNGAWHCDPCGGYGYEIEDARALPPGEWDIARMRQLPIAGSEGAWNDLRKPGNTINGYLVDARRSQQDLLKWQGPREPLPDAREDRDELVARVHRQCQFPPGEREIAYQDFWVGLGDPALAPLRIEGQRRVVERAKALGFFPASGETVLDVGCQSGGFLQYAARMAGGGVGGRLVGVDVDPVYVDCARALMRSCGYNVCVRQVDVVRERAEFRKWVRMYFPQGVDHLLTLSLEKHIGDDYLFELIDAIGARRTYVETNAVGKTDADAAAAPMKLWEQVRRRGGEHVGDSRDRSLRRLYRIERR